MKTTSIFGSIHSNTFFANRVVRQNFYGSNLKKTFRDYSTTSTAASSPPLLGIHYVLWFNGEKGNCDGPGWKHPVDGQVRRPFQQGDIVKSFAVPSGCYSSKDPNSAFNHALLFGDLGIDCVILDFTNTAKFASFNGNPDYPAVNPTLDGFRTAFEQFPSRLPKKLQITFQMSLTCWGEQYNTNYVPDVGTHNKLEVKSAMNQFKGDMLHSSDAGKSEFFTYTDAMKNYILRLYKHAKSFPDEVVLIDGKPLILFYCNLGNNIFDPWTFDPSKDEKNKFKKIFYGDSRLGYRSNTFPGAGVPPLPLKFDDASKIEREIEDVYAQVRDKSVYDLFTVRFTIAQPNPLFSVENHSAEVWPFSVAMGQNGEVPGFKDCGYASLQLPGIERSAETYNQFIKGYNARNPKFIFIKSWNEFSTTDEEGYKSYTVEPNTYHKKDLAYTPKNPAVRKDGAWFYFN
ncbi:MAG: hypothetical protein JSS53_09320, partial [Proteobacteria bacterium]|nr:hypothetical protein [Pseudomonadota bacterium]